MVRTASIISITTSLIAMIAAVDAAAQRPTPPITIAGGSVTGIEDKAVIAFKGIPFAAPPVGPLRWRAPQPVRPWSGVRAATAFGHDCMQLPFPSDAAPLGATPAEDCLVLNIWRPAAHAKARPVVVWIYGGGFVNGGSSPAVYDGAAFARQDVVFVSFNYRLGRFGFFAHPALSGANEGPLGNYGLLDQIAALKWVQANIAKFGGDPAKVTVMGESAGGSSVLNLMASPMAKGLFQQAISMSGGGRKLVGGVALHATRPGEVSAEEMGMNFAQSVGIAGTDAKALAALRALPAERVRGDINLANRGPVDKPTYVGGPIVDGRIVVGTTDGAMRAGTAMRIPMMVGSTSADIGFFSEKSKDALFAAFGSQAAAVRAAYDPGGTAALSEVGPQVARDRLMVEPARFVAQQTQRVGQPAFLYRFGYVAASMRKDWAGAPHATDIPYFFDTVAVKYGAALTAEDAKAGKLANAYAVNFIRKGDPNGAGLPKWSAFDTARDNVQVLDAEGSAENVVDPLKPHLDAIQAAAPQ
ncbi:carboxylesterase/lipase family protein [Sphingomonas sp. OK281]|uniref:carboxylesterase/lipase family protein n=1 Tax=Sphingomonas sp. OK281 TaxID=1881067 RepID=UPI0008E3C17A|nr:carboxylesterase family protein [Sphingomonas sp. OK281]SFO03198.1 para-nitrobenzyl esterase [Sphingomonas sp. OK281]